MPFLFHAQTSGLLTTPPPTPPYMGQHLSIQLCTRTGSVVGGGYDFTPSLLFILFFTFFFVKALISVVTMIAG